MALLCNESKSIDAAAIGVSVCSDNLLRHRAPEKLHAAPAGCANVAARDDCRLIYAAAIGVSLCLAFLSVTGWSCPRMACSKPMHKANSGTSATSSSMDCAACLNWKEL